MTREENLIRDTGFGYREIIAFALPMAAAGILQILFNVADQVIIGRFSGYTSLAAVGVNAPLVQIFVSLLNGFPMGVNIVAGLYFGAKNSEGIRRTVGTSVLVGLGFGFFMMAVAMLLTGPLLRWMEAPADVLPGAILYFEIYCLGIPGIALYNSLSAILRASGDSRRPVYCLLAAGAVNVVLNLVFVVALHMDIAGVAIATALSQWLSAGLVVMIMRREKGLLHLGGRLRPHMKEAREIFRNGLPAGVQNAIFNVANIFVQSAINTFGAVVMAGSSAAATLEGLLLMVVDAFSQATITFASRRYGAGDVPGVRSVVWRTSTCTIVCGLSVGWLMIAFGHQLLGIFTPEAAVVDAGMNRFRLTAATYFLYGLMAIAANGQRCMGHPIVPTVVSLLGSCVLRIVWVSWLFPLAPTQTMIFSVFGVSWLVTATANYISFRHFWRKEMKAVQ